MGNQARQDKNTLKGTADPHTCALPSLFHAYPERPRISALCRKRFVLRKFDSNPTAGIIAPFESPGNTEYGYLRSLDWLYGFDCKTLPMP